MSSLRHAVVRLLEQRALSEERLHALQALEQRDGASRPMGAPSLLRRRYAVAALLATAIALPALVWHLLPPRGSAPDVARLIAEEVAANHVHLKPLEIETNTISGIRGYFTQLDFRPVESGMMMLDGLALLGGRYCSVQGVTAAQLRLRRSKGDAVHTLYQVPYDHDRFGPLPHLEAGKTPVMVRTRGLDVFAWVEKDILFALISEP